MASEMKHNQNGFTKIFKGPSKILRYELVKLFGLFILFFSFLSVNIVNTVFCDEADNFLGGMSVVGGGDIYGTYFSQHMPVMYYLCALFRVLGASTIISFRIYFFIFLAIFFVLMYKRYSKSFGQLTMILYPIGYAIVMQLCKPLTNSVTSDVMQAQGMVILLLEFLLFIRVKKFDLGNYVWISISVFISFGVAFVSIFAIAAIGIGVFSMEVKFWIKDKRGIKEEMSMLFKKYWKLVVAVAAPFVLLIIWYAISGNLKNFYLGAYKINTDIYSKYQDGFGVSPIKTFFSGYIDYFNYFISLFNGIMPTFDGARNAIILLMIVAQLIFLIWISKKEGMLVGLIISFFIIKCGPRGFFNWHAMAQFSITIIMMCFFLNKFYKIHKVALNKVSNISKVICVIVMIAFVGTIFIKFSNFIPNYNTIVVNEGYATSTDVRYIEFIKKLTGQNERIYIQSLNTDLFLNANRLPAIAAASSTPWTYEMYGNIELKVLNESKPKVVIYSPEYEVWGHKASDYAPEIRNFIIKNYKVLSRDIPMLYVRNDFANEAYKITGDLPSVFETTSLSGTIDPILDGKKIVQVFKANFSKINYIGFNAGTYARKNTSKMKVQLVDIDSKKVIARKEINVPELLDNRQNKIGFNCAVKKNNRYALEFIPSGANANNCITIYRTQDNTADANTYSIVDGKKQNYNLGFSVY